MESLKQSVNYVTESISNVTGSGASEPTIDSNDSVGNENTNPTSGTTGSSNGLTDKHDKSLMGGSAPSNSTSTYTSGNADDASGIVMTEDGRQTYAPDGHRSSEAFGGTHSGSDDFARQTASAAISQPSTMLSGGSVGGSDATPALGASAMQSADTSRGDYTTNPPGSTANSSNPNNSSTSHGTTGLDSTASGRDDINNSNRAAPADHAPDPSSTEGSAEVAAENPQMASKQMSGTNDEQAGDSGSGGHQSHSSARENEGAIPIAGRERLGEKHWGESKKIPE